MKAIIFFVLLMVSVGFCTNAQTRPTTNAQPVSSTPHPNPINPATSISHPNPIKPVPLENQISLPRHVANEIQIFEPKPIVLVNEMYQKKQISAPIQEKKTTQSVEKKENAKIVEGCCCKISDEFKQPDTYKWCINGVLECAKLGGTVVSDDDCK